MARYDASPPSAAGWGTPTLIRWGAVFGGMVLGFATLALLSMLWLAVASTGAGQGAVSNNLDWFLAGSAVVAMFLGGLIAGWLSGVPLSSAGFFNGLTVWGLILIGTLAVGVPGLLQMMGMDLAAITPQQATTQATGALGAGGDALWAVLLALVIGALSAGLGGAIGGAITRPAYAGTLSFTEHETRTERHDGHVRRDVRGEDDVRDGGAWDHDRVHHGRAATGDAPADARTVDLREEDATAGAGFRRRGEEDGGTRR